MRRCWTRLIVAGLTLAVGWSQAEADPGETVQQAEQVLAELVAIPGKQIPKQLLSEAHGIAVIPRVIKVGFVAGIRRGHGVVLVRDAEGEWSLPQFVRLTGGSVGWQAGVQGTDVVLVFKSQRSVDQLAKGKFTIGADASAAAGPVGRSAEAATDASLTAEILSYSRSRGLFLGVAIDGSSLEIDHEAHGAFYQSPAAAVPAVVPPSAVHLRDYVVELTGGRQAPTPSTQQAGPVVPLDAASTVRLEALRRTLTVDASQLHAILNPEWQQYLALPPETLDPAAKPNIEALSLLYQRLQKINSAPEYKDLTARVEFQTTFELMREYLEALTKSGSTLNLPQPPSDRR